MSVILSTGGGVHLPRQILPRADSPLGRHPLPGRHPPRQTPPPHPETDTAADGTHPTGMHSCFETACAKVNCWLNIIYGKNYQLVGYFSADKIISYFSAYSSTTGSLLLTRLMTSLTFFSNHTTTSGSFQQAKHRPTYTAINCFNASGRLQK